MKLAGFDFPSIKEADAMFSAQVAPDWHDGSECFRCRSEFSLFNRKHHCRACGQIFCDRCSTKEIPLPQFGIEKEVRVCDACFEKISSKTSETKVVKSEPLASTSVKEDISQAEKEKLLKEKEEEDLALALAISQSEGRSEGAGAAKILVRNIQRMQPRYRRTTHPKWAIKELRPASLNRHPIILLWMTLSLDISIGTTGNS
ncbi:FYVE zinc finger, partial [Ostertagia ostertagi]